MYWVTPAFFNVKLAADQGIAIASEHRRTSLNRRTSKLLYARAADCWDNAMIHSAIVFSCVAPTYQSRRVRVPVASRPRTHKALFFSSLLLFNNRCNSDSPIAALFNLNQSQLNQLSHCSPSYLSGQLRNFGR